MDSSTILTSGIFILFCMILYVLVNRSKKKKEKQLLIPLRSLAETDNCEISHYDIWNDSVIGIDETKNIIFSIRKTKEKETSVVVYLADFFRCRVTEVSRTSGPKEGNIKAFDRIDLVFNNKDKNKSDINVEFYNANTDRLTLTGELQVAEKWCKIANDRIASLTK